MVSSILSNVYLDRLDKYVEQVMLPRHNQAKVRRRNRAYTRKPEEAARLESRGIT
jgi:hypothetical protein